MGAYPGPRSCVKALGGPLPGPLQTIDGAELLALLAILRRSVAPIQAHSDADYVVKGFLERGRVAATSHEAVWAEV